MNRRGVLTLLGGAAVAAGPVRARAQQGKRPIVGFLGTATAQLHGTRVVAFAQRMRELGWIEGSSVSIEYRWAEGSNERAVSFATEFVHLPADVIVTAGTPTVIAIKEAVGSTPIVFALAADPIGSGLVSSLSRPGANITGLSLQSPDIAGKRLALLREVDPNLRRVGFMGNHSNPAVPNELHEIQTAGKSLGLEVISPQIRRAQDVIPAFEQLKDNVQALYLANDGLVDFNRLRINILAAGAHLPTMWTQQELVEAGGLLSYGPNYSDLYRRTADLVDKILHGTKPGDIPVEQPLKFDLVINLTVAKALGIVIPPMLVARANAVIE